MKSHFIEVSVQINDFSADFSRALRSSTCPFENFGCENALYLESHNADVEGLWHSGCNLNYQTEHPRFKPRIFQEHPTAVEAHENVRRPETSHDFASLKREVNVVDGVEDDHVEREEVVGARHYIVAVCQVLRYVEHGTIQNFRIFA